MKKTITVLSVITMIVSCLSVLLAIANLTVFWKFECLLYTHSTEVITNGPIVPVGTMIYLFGCFAAALLLLVSCRTRRFIAIEIIALVLIIGVPVLQAFINPLQQASVNAMGIIAVTASAVTSHILNMPVVIMGLAASLCLVTSGMRIAYKNYLKKENQYQ